MRRRIIKKTAPVSTDFSIGLVRYFKFNSSMTDEIGPQSPITNVGTTYGTGKVGGSRVFDGGSNYALYNGTSNLNMSNAELNDIPFSVSVWLKVDSTVLGPGTEGCIIGVIQELNSAFQWRVQRFSSGLTFSLFSKSNIYGSHAKSISTSINADVWALYTFTYDGTISGASGMAAYKNGILISTVANIATSYTGMRNITPQYAIGRRTTQTYSFYKGEMDELAIWKNRVLTPLEVNELYNKGNSGISII